MELLFVVTLSLFVVLLAKCVVSGTTNCLGGLLLINKPIQQIYTKYKCPDRKISL